MSSHMETSASGGVPGPARPAPREEVRRLVLDAGFDRAGFAAAGPAPAAERLRRWLDRGFAGTQAYLERTFERRADPRRVLEGARTVIAVALHYRRPGPAARDAAPAVAGSARGPGSPRGAIAAYALGEDYHEIMARRLRRACEALAAAYPAAYRWYVDTGPVLERDWAAAAGIGWIGKNTCAIDPRDGSYFFLGSILTTLELEPDPPATDHCGTCRLCIDACPTGAIVAPYELDSRLCISYLTIEHRGEFPPALEPAAGSLVFGCDICQEVCPFNREERGERAGGDQELAPRSENLAPELAELARLDVEGFRRRFRRSAVRRAKLAGMLRNVAVALGNAPGVEAAALLEELASRAEAARDPVLAGTVRRALERMRQGAEDH